MVVIPADIDEILENADLEYIRLCHEDIGVLRKYLEDCDDERRWEWVQHFIRVNEIEIENLMEDIEIDRRSREAKELSRGRPGYIVSGNEVEAGQPEEIGGISQEQHSFPR